MNNIIYLLKEYRERTFWDIVNADEPEVKEYYEQRMKEICETLMNLNMQKGA